MQPNSDLGDLHQPENPIDKNQEAINQEWQDAKSNPGLSEFQELKNKYTELDDSYKRLWADQQNMVSRFNREKLEVHKYAASNAIETILPALDNFDFAKKSINENTSHKDVIKSIEMLQEQLLMSLKALGLEEVDTNCTYNAAMHEAINKVSDPEKPDGTIIEVLKKGFKLKDKILRVATVIVTSRE